MLHRQEQLTGAYSGPRLHEGPRFNECAKCIVMTHRPDTVTVLNAAI